jgi:hypothetical protein
MMVHSPTENGFGRCVQRIGKPHQAGLSDNGRISSVQAICSFSSSRSGIRAHPRPLGW